MWTRTFTPKAGGVPSRVLKLQGAVNFRDLGGYSAGEGRRIKRYQVFRSASLGRLTAADFRRIDRLGLKAVFDLRMPEERERAPTNWAGLPVTIRSFIPGQSGDLGAVAAAFAAPDLQPEAVSTIMLKLYRGLPYEQAPAYSEVFRHLAAGDTPLLFHCAAGKDRTGVLAALILLVLRVPEPLVIEDYALSSRIVDYREEMQLDADPSNKRDGYEVLRTLPANVVAPLLASAPAYIQESIAEVKRRHGSVDEFIKVEYGLTENQLRDIRNNLLE